MNLTLIKNETQLIKCNKIYKKNIEEGNLNSDQKKIKKKRNIYDLNSNDLETFVVSNKHEKYRTAQIRNALYSNISKFQDILTVPQLLRQQLDQSFSFGSLKCLTQSFSKIDGTIKRTYQLESGEVIESVLMCYDDGRYTACISSQAGCAMGCTFCATGKMGIRRNLTSTEIYEQVLIFHNILKPEHKLTNVVFMGMGEPFLNYKNVLESCKRITQDLGIGSRHITISTVGIVPKIIQFANDQKNINLAVSLHNPFNDERMKIMPITEKYSVETLMSSCYQYCKTTNKRLSFEYCVIPGINDSEKHASKVFLLLALLLKPIYHLYHINIIPLNPTPNYSPQPKNGKSIDQSINQFIKDLEYNKLTKVTVREKRGIDISAGCGQLAFDVEENIINMKK